MAVIVRGAASWTLVVGLCLVSCSSCSRNLDTRESQVIGAFISSYVKNGPAVYRRGLVPVVVLGRTSFPTDFSHPITHCTEAGPISPDEVSALRRVNRFPRRIAPDVPAEVKFSLLSPSTLKEMEKSGHYWDVLEQHFPRADRFLVISRPVFDSNGMRAVLYFELRCSLCGAGGFVVLTRGQDGWTYEDSCILWVS